MKLKRINDFEVEPLVKKKPRTTPFDDLFFERYSNVFILAGTNSGKTVTISNILEHDHRNGEWLTFAFVSTADLDPEWIKMKKRFEIVVSTSIHDEENGENLVQELLTRIAEILDHLPSDEAKLLGIHCIFDDIGHELTDPIIGHIAKRNRHYHIRNIFSSQRLVDLNKHARSTLDAALLFPNLPIEDLKNFKKELGNQQNMDSFIKMYKFATKERYSFLYIDVKHKTYRKNFNETIVFENDA